MTSEHRPVQTKARSPREQGMSAPLRVLVADDDRLVLELMTSFLTKLGYQALPAGNGGEALRVFRQGGVDMVLSDVKMPGLDGLDLLKAVKEAQPRTPVILISGYSDTDSLVTALNHGAQNFLRKPIRFDELSQVLDRVRLTMNLHRAQANSPLIQEQSTSFVLPSRQEYIGEFLHHLTQMAIMVGFAELDLESSVKMAIDEAVINAMEHGNQGDQDKTVEIETEVSSQRLLVRIKDQGEGYDPDQVPDPTDPDNLASNRGRGLFLIRAIMDQALIHPPGNLITLIKHRSPPGDQVSGTV